MKCSNFFYGLEDEDNDADDVSMTDLVKDETTVVDDAGKDSETVDVSDTSTKEAEHNEEASAGGVVVGDNAEDLTMDPVAATESLIRRTIGLSREDLDEVQEQLEATHTEPDGDENGLGVGDNDEDDDLAAVTTVNVVAPANGSTEIVPPAISPDADAAATVAAAAPAEPVDVVPEVETASAVAGVEFLYRLQRGTEDDATDAGTAAPAEGGDDGTDSDVEFDVKTPNNDVNIALEDKAVTIEPNDTGDSTPATTEAPAEDTSAAPAEGGEEEGGEEGGETPAEGGEAPAEGGEESGQESWFRF